MRKASSYDLIRARRAGSSGILVGRQTIQSAQQLELAGLLFAEDVSAGRGERQRVPGIDRELNAVVLGPKVARPMAAEPAAAVGDRRAHHHELRQVVVERAQAVADPRADRGKDSFEHVPAGVELQLGAVIVVGRPHRADDGQVVDARADVRPPVADLDPGLAPLAIADLKRIEHLANVAVGVVGHHDPHVVGELVLEGLGERRLGDRLARVSIQGGLGIEALQVAGAADHEQPDDVLGPGREMRLSVGRLPAGRIACHRPGAGPSRCSIAAERHAGQDPSPDRSETLVS